MTGRSTVYTAADVKPESLKNLPLRQMDCMDCHNRPTHTFQLPERAVDLAMQSGAISPALPFIKKVAVESLRKEYKSQAQGAAGIRAAIEGYYQTGDRAAIDRTAAAVVAIYDAQRVPEHAHHLGSVPQQPRPHGFPRLLPLPRRQPH